MNILDSLTKLRAIVVEMLLTGIALMTCASLIGRNTTGDSIVGAFELTAATITNVAFPDIQRRGYSGPLATDLL